jgi:hypothetical protein
MSDYLSRVVARTLSVARVVQPRVPVRFEPLKPFDGLPLQDVQTIERTIAPPDPARTVRRDDDRPRETPGESEPEPFRGQHLPIIQRPDESPVRSGQDNRRVDTVEGRDLLHEPRLVADTVARPIAVAASRDQIARPLPVPPIPDPPTPVQTLAAAEVAVPPIGRAATAGRRADRSNTYPATDGTASIEPAVPARAAQAPPTIKVHIGRIEVRAVIPPAPAQRPVAPKPVPTLALKDYLRHRREDRR